MSLLKMSVLGSKLKDLLFENVAFHILDLGPKRVKNETHKTSKLTQKMTQHKLSQFYANFLVAGQRGHIGLHSFWLFINLFLTIKCWQIFHFNWPLFGPLVGMLKMKIQVGIKSITNIMTSKIFKTRWCPKCPLHHHEDDHIHQHYKISVLKMCARWCSK